MKKVTIYFKSGNVLNLKCRDFIFTVDKDGTNRELSLIAPNFNEWMFDLGQIECYIIKKTFLGL